MKKCLLISLLFISTISQANDKREIQLQRILSGTLRPELNWGKNGGESGNVQGYYKFPASLAEVLEGVSLKQLKDEFRKYVYVDGPLFSFIIAREKAENFKYRECIEDGDTVPNMGRAGRMCINYLLNKFGYRAEWIRTKSKGWSIEIPYAVSQKKAVLLTFACDDDVNPIPENDAIEHYHQVVYAGNLIIGGEEKSIYIDSNGTSKIVDFELFKSAYVSGSAFIVEKNLFPIL